MNNSTYKDLPELARKTVENYVTTSQILAVPETGLDAFRDQRAGVFVTIKTSDDKLRGCIGTISPVCETILHETIQNAISAATRDPRFLPVEADELECLNYEVSVLYPPEPAASLADLDPIKYGVIVSSRGRRGLLLPDLDGINTAEEQVRHAMYKAGLHPSETVVLQRFLVDKYMEA